MTFKELQDDTLERTTLDSNAVASSARTRVKRFINETYRRLVRETGISRLLTGATAIETVAGQADYAVTGAQIKMIFDTVARRVLTEVTLADLRLYDPSSSAVGAAPEFYAVSKVGATTLTVTLYPTPTTTGSLLSVDLGSALTPLAADGDIPVVPIDFHYLLGTGARMLEAEKMQQFDNYSLCRDELKAGLGKLRLFLARSRRGQSVMNRKGTFNAQYGGNWIDWGL